MFRPGRPAAEAGDPRMVGDMGKIPELYTGDGFVEDPDGSRRWGVLGAAGLFLVTDDRHVLMQHRAKWTNRGGTWALPGGAIDVGESPTDGALRETWEETGVGASSVKVHREIVTSTVPVKVAYCRLPVRDDEWHLFADIETMVERSGDPCKALQDFPVRHPSLDASLNAHGIFGLGGTFWWQYENPEINEWTYTTVLATCSEHLELHPTAESLELLWQPIDQLEELPLMPEFKASLPAIRAAVDSL